MLAGDSSAVQKNQEKKGMLDQIADFFRTKVKPFLERVANPSRDPNKPKVPTKTFSLAGAHSVFFEDSEELRQEAEEMITQVGGWQAFAGHKIDKIVQHLGTVKDALAFAFLGVFLGKWKLEIPPKSFMRNGVPPPDDLIRREVRLKLA